MRVVVTGGAGYIGSVVTEFLADEGFDVHVIDDLSTGHRAAVDNRARFTEIDLLDTAALTRILEEGCDAVCHFAAFSQVSESMSDPIKYYKNNICGAVSLLKAMRDTDTGMFLFSSTAAVYGEPEEIPITEKSPLSPVNPYGNTKLAIERMLDDCHEAWGVRPISLRYFNAAGASDRHGEDHRPESHLIPLVLDAVEGRRGELVVYGDDYPTDDGTCVRDYIHVRDLAAAHVLALKKLSEGYTGSMNLGNGRGFSVFEVIKAASRVTGKEVPHRIGKRRKGDPAVLVASSQKASSILGWKQSYAEIEKIIEDAYRWRKANPDGYPD